ncbi:hypothetical protein HanPI659440_Chr06g0234031 [Helianthus annuus]|nr:hypothetical protein HanPI659440_Chr06g0234031 [Helianthus annuus]
MGFFTYTNMRLSSDLIDEDGVVDTRVRGGYGTEEEMTKLCRFEFSSYIQEFLHSDMMGLFTYTNMLLSSDLMGLFTYTNTLLYVMLVVYFYNFF